MGGKAIKSARRFAAEEYRAAELTAFAILRETLPGRRIEAVPYYRLKPDFGDLDVLVESEGLPRGWREKISTAFQSIEVAPNGPVCSFEFRGLQVDAILAPQRQFDFSLSYYAWNDLGNLLGRIAHRHGFKLGHKGLLYPLRDGTHLIAEVPVTTEFPEALDLLGLDPARWRRGFDTLEEIFRFVSSSTRFDPSMFPLEHRSHRSRVRDAKRPTYTRFLAWCEKAEPLRGKHASEDLLEIALETHPEFKKDLESAQAGHAWRKRVHTRFNGRLVSEWTGLQGRDLGEFMHGLKCRLRRQSDDMDKWILTVPEEEIRRLVLDELKRFQGPEGFRAGVGLRA